MISVIGLLTVNEQGLWGRMGEDEVMKLTQNVH
jgi:hypothetical protein